MSSLPQAVRVAVRVRPMSQTEIAQGYDPVVKVVSEDSTNEITIGDGKMNSERFTFTHVFGPDATQQQLYETSVSQLLMQLFQGFNVTILAYGQTSSGKTFTMGTDFSGHLDDNVGVIPRSVSDIFKMIESRKQKEDGYLPVSIACSFIELYQETVYDLLSTNRQAIDIREGPGGIVMLQGLTEVSVDSVQATLDCLVRGTSGRCVGATAMNSVSSRSHAIFTVTIEQPAIGDSKSVVKSKFHLVDLAGSERSKKTQATGDRFKEGVKINQGLLALGNVISTLSSLSGNVGSGTASVHVPYRDSKLTRLLQDSLGGNSHTLMIACVSPAGHFYSETVSTLRYADRVLKIKNKPLINVDPQRAEIRRLETIIAELRQEILLLKEDQGLLPAQDSRSKSSKPSVESERIASSDTFTVVRLQQMEEKNRLLQSELQSMVQYLATKEIRALTAEKTLEDIEEKLMLQDENNKIETQENDDDGDVNMDSSHQIARPSDLMEFIGSMMKTYRQDRRMLELPPVEEKKPSDSQSEDMLEESYSHTQQQIRMHDELNQLNRVLAGKEQLRRRYLNKGEGESSARMVSIGEVTRRLEETEATIQALETQLSEQNALLEAAKASEKTVKLAEERRRKLCKMEAELAAVRQKSLALTNQLKMKEQNIKCVPLLTAEIKEMKAARVQLLKAMRAEQEKFRQSRQNQEKQICQLKAKDRKRQYEMQKMEVLHELQKKVMRRNMEMEKKGLQRKMDKTDAVNRRLKAALERRQNRQGSNTDQSKLQGAEAIRWINHELELLESAVDAMETFKILVKHRDAEVETLSQLKAEESAVNDTMNTSSTQELRVERISNLEKSLALRNQTIADLEQKVRAINIEELVISAGETMATLPDAREAFCRLLDALVKKIATIIEERFEKMELQETIAQTSPPQQNVISKLEFIDNMNPEEQYQHLLDRFKHQLQHASLDGGALIMLTEQVLREFNQMRDELCLYKASNQMQQRRLEELRSGVTNEVGPANKKPKFSKRFSAVEEEPELDLEELVESESEEDLERDPTFRGTPISKRKKLDSSVPKASETITTTSVNNTSLPHCSCSGICSTRRCGCQKNGVSCSTNCKCPEGCVNVESDKNDGSNAPLDSLQEQKENTLSSSNKDQAKTTEKRPEADDEMDILTYVKKHMKRKPLIDM